MVEPQLRTLQVGGKAWNGTLGPKPASMPSCQMASVWFSLALPLKHSISHSVPWYHGLNVCAWPNIHMLKL